MQQEWGDSLQVRSISPHHSRHSSANRGRATKHSKGLKPIMARGLPRDNIEEGLYELSRRLLNPRFHAVFLLGYG